MDGWGRFQVLVLAAFVLIFSAKLAHALASGVRPLAIGIGKSGVARWIELALPFSFVVWAWVVLSHTAAPSTAVLPWPAYVKILDALWLRLAGAVAIVLALIVLAAALISFGRSWRVGVADPGELITRGAFAVSRNPIFLALNLTCIGTFLINGSLVLLGLALVEIAGIHFQILQEERYLRRRFGRQYEQYFARTRRYFGWRSAAIRG